MASIYSKFQFHKLTDNNWSNAIHSQLRRFSNTIHLMGFSLKFDDQQKKKRKRKQNELIENYYNNNKNSRFNIDFKSVSAFDCCLILCIIILVWSFFRHMRVATYGDHFSPYFISYEMDFVTVLFGASFKISFFTWILCSKKQCEFNTDRI